MARMLERRERPESVVDYNRRPHPETIDRLNKHLDSSRLHMGPNLWEAVLRLVNFSSPRGNYETVSTYYRASKSGLQKK